MQHIKEGLVLGLIESLTILCILSVFSPDLPSILLNSCRSIKQSTTLTHRLRFTCIQLNLLRNSPSFEPSFLVTNTLDNYPKTQILALLLFFRPSAFCFQNHCPLDMESAIGEKNMSSTLLSLERVDTSRERKKSLKEKYPEIYAQTNIDRRGCKRVMPMEILSLGMGRTGTMCKFLTL
jgi:hypothetical protein